VIRHVNLQGLLYRGSPYCCEAGREHMSSLTGENYLLSQTCVIINDLVMS